MGAAQNLAASVHQRLLNRAKESGRPFQELLQLFAIERFVYRLSQSPHAKTFVLKGALMFVVWGGPVSRPTRDIDLLGETNNDVDVVAAVFADVCETSVEPDGLSFDAGSVIAKEITRGAEYVGVRVRLMGSLGKSRVSIQVDVGVGDVITPAPQQVEYPTILDFPAPHIRGYTMESTIAEKLQAMVKLGIANSRMKDFYDVLVLSRAHDFEGLILAQAIANTFAQRTTTVSPAASLFTAAFATDSDKQIQWAAFVEKAALSDAPDLFVDVMAGVVLFVGPVAVTLSEGGQFDATWVAPGPWALKRRR